MNILILTHLQPGSYLLICNPALQPIFQLEYKLVDKLSCNCLYGNHLVKYILHGSRLEFSRLLEKQHKRG